MLIRRLPSAWLLFFYKSRFFKDLKKRERNIEHCIFPDNYIIINAVIFIQKKAGFL